VVNDSAPGHRRCAVISMPEGRKVLLCALIASLGAPAVLTAVVLLINLERYGETDLSVAAHYGLAIWLFSLIATLAAAGLILMLRRAFAGRVNSLVLAAAVAALLVLLASMGLGHDAAISLSVAAAITFVAFVLAWLVLK
jgi:nitrate reductase gamma subunit